MTGPLCGRPHYDHPQTLCTEPAGHYQPVRDPHAGPLIIGGRQCGGVAWDEPKDNTVTDRPTLEDLDADPDTPWCCGGNAEDCPLCDTATLPYPFLCPGHPDTAENRQRVQAAADNELTAEEARDLVDELGTDLYWAQDRLAFVGECCDIADREQRPITTADVREWLKGARCGRQLAVDAAIAALQSKEGR